MMEDFDTDLAIYWWPAQAPDVDDFGNSDLFRTQPFVNEVGEFHELRNALGDDNLPGPMKPGTPRLPWDILEFVPLYPDENRRSRSERLKRDLLDEIDRAQLDAVRGADTLLRGRDIDTYWSNEEFIDKTLGFIFNLLAFDPGLSRIRMLELGKMFHSLLMEPWYIQYGHLGRPQGQSPQYHEDSNLALRNIIIRMDNMATSQDLQEIHLDYDGSWWGNVAYDQVLNQRIDNATGEHLQNAANGTWQSFYKTWLQILANVEVSFVSATQEQLDNATSNCCGICGDDFNMDNDYDCAVVIPCGNNHMLCKKCYTQLSLTPTRPYTSMITTKNCPHCRGEINYTESMKNLTDGLRLMPRLNTDFPYTTITN